jgi:transposase InsO family protein
VFLDLREAGETCSKHRVERLMRENGLRATTLSHAADLGEQTRRTDSERPQRAAALVHVSRHDLAALH